MKRKIVEMPWLSKRDRAEEGTLWWENGSVWSGIAFCCDAVDQLFDIPAEARKVRFLEVAKPSKWTQRVSIGSHCTNVRTDCFNGRELPLCLSAKGWLMDRGFGGRTIYVECEWR